MKPSLKLEPQYGKLTPGESTIRQNRRYVSCTCECGRVVEKLYNNLRSGRTQSCGRGACRVGVTYDGPPLRVTGPTVIDMKRLEKAWNRYHHDDIAQRRSIEQLAEIHRVKLNTLHSLFRKIKRCGGFTQYKAAVVGGRRE